MNGKQNAVDVLTGSNKDEANFGICGPGAGLAGRGGAGHDARRVQDRRAAQVRRAGGPVPEALSRRVRCRRAACGARSLRGRNQLEHAAVGGGAGEAGQEGLHLLLHPHSDAERSSRRRRAPRTRRRSPIAFNNPKGQATQTWNDVDTKLADRCRPTGSTSSPRAIRTATACRNGRSSRVCEQQSDGARGRASGGACGTSGETSLLQRGVPAPVEGSRKLGAVQRECTYAQNERPVCAYGRTVVAKGRPVDQKEWTYAPKGRPVDVYGRQVASKGRLSTQKNGRKRKKSEGFARKRPLLPLHFDLERHTQLECEDRVRLDADGSSRHRLSKRSPAGGERGALGRAAAVREGAAALLHQILHLHNRSRSASRTALD